MYLYDIECIPNCFTAIFIEAHQSKLIDEYIKADINNDITVKEYTLKRLKKQIFVIYEGVNDLHRFYKFLTTPNNVFVSYNGLHYDNIMIDYMYHNYKTLRVLNVDALTTTMKQVNDRVIQSDGLWFETRNMLNIPYNKNYKSIDLMRLLYLYKPRVSLKQVSVNLKWYKLEEYHMPDYTYEQYEELYGTLEYTYEEVHNFKSFDRKLHSSELGNFLSYNYNDVFILNKLLDYSAEELQSRLLIQKQYGLDVISDARSSVANKVVRDLYSKYTGLAYRDFETQRSWYKIINFRDLIFDNVSFKTPELKQLLVDLKNVSIRPMDGSSNFSKTFKFRNKMYNMGLGGLHSKDMGAIYYSDDIYAILDADVNSYYPYGIVNYKIKPRHLSIVFLEIVKNWITQRIHYKTIGDLDNSGIFKIFINAIYGKLGDADSFIKDDLAMYTVTVNLQLFLIMLIEDLELAKFNVISANTDGVTALVERTRNEEYFNILEQWSKVTKFTFEVNEYGLYVRSQVNAYIATIVSNGQVKKVKVKGEFDPEGYKDFKRGYKHPVVAKAIYDYFINKLPIKDTIINHTDILDFCISQKTGGNFVNELHLYENKQAVIKTLSKTIRYYVSKKGGILLKRDKNDNSRTNMLKGSTVTLLHKLENKPISDYDIDYTFYIGKAYDLYERITNTKTKLMKKTSGALFDNLKDYE